MTEIWKRIDDEYDPYEVSNMARVRDNITGRILKPYVNDNGYLVVSLALCYGNHRKHAIRKVHRLMMIAFKGYDKKRPVVNHKDGNKLNNSLDNLEWATSSENNRHAYATGLKSADYLLKDYVITIDDQVFEIHGAENAAKKLHEMGYFTDVSVYNLRAAIVQCSLSHKLYLGKLKVEKTDDRYDEVPKYNKCGIKGRTIYAELPSGMIIKAKGPANLARFGQQLGVWKDKEHTKLVKLLSEAALSGTKCGGCKVWYEN